MSVLYQCPYSPAIKCNMELPCKGCEDFSRVIKNNPDLKVRVNVVQVFFDALELVLENLDNLVAVDPVPELKIIPNNAESGETRAFVDAKLCSKCNPTGWLERLMVSQIKYSDVIVCCICGHEQKIGTTKIK